MKLMVASDIHGSEFFCSKLINCFNNEKPDKLLLLGDILYHGPRNNLPDEYNPKSVITMLNNIKSQILCVRGNCDTEVDQMVLDFPILSDSLVLFIAGKTIFATHGHHKVTCDSGYDIILSGHTHIPVNKIEDNILFLNPGSVSFPKENSQNGYIILESKNDNQIDIHFKTLDGNIYKI